VTLTDRPTVEELEHLHASLTREERDEFLSRPRPVPP